MDNEMSTFESWSSEIMQSLFEYTDKELTDLKRNLVNMSLYGAYDKLIEAIENEQFSREEISTKERI
jgi:hypothetical protein